jgi:hypothetical protein
MSWTKQEVKVLKSNGYKESSEGPHKFVDKKGYDTATRSGNTTLFGNGDKKNRISLSRLDEKTRK